MARNLFHWLKLLASVVLLSTGVAQAQSTPASRFLERLTFYGSDGVEPPMDSVATAVQLVRIWPAPQPDGSFWVLYCFRPALATNFYLKRFWLRVESSPEAGADTTFGESRLMQVPSPLSAQLARLCGDVGRSVLPPHSVYVGTGPRPPATPRERRQERRAHARTPQYGGSVYLWQAPPYRVSYRTTLDPLGNEDAALVRQLGRAPARYYRHQRGAYRRAWRLMREFIPE